jgi:hypothetical protein
MNCTDKERDVKKGEKDTKQRRQTNQLERERERERKKYRRK